jgi:hypothetical protein
MMGKRARRALILAAALAVPIAVHLPVAQAAARQTLLQRYQPVLVMDGLEQFTPTTVGSFVADARLETQTSAGVWTVVDATPRPGDLPTKPTTACVDQGLTPCYRLNQVACSPAGGTAALACYRDAWQDPAPRSVVYGRAVGTMHGTVLQYWYFSYDDLYSYNYPPDDLFWQAHEGDWEMVSVLVRHGHAVTAGYSQHCTGERRPWSDVERWNGTAHPVVYVANGSHANLFASGEHPIAQQCIPQQAIALLTQYGLPMPGDHSHPAGVAFGPAGLAGVSTTSISVVSTPPRYLRFAGTWGEDQVFHAPAPIGTVVQGTSPDSPAKTDAWRHPLRTLFGWPLSS